MHWQAQSQIVCVCFELSLICFVFRAAASSQSKNNNILWELWATLERGAVCYEVSSVISETLWRSQAEGVKTNRVLFSYQRMFLLSVALQYRCRPWGFASSSYYRDRIIWKDPPVLKQDFKRRGCKDDHGELLWYGSVLHCKPTPNWMRHDTTSSSALYFVHRARAQAQVPPPPIVCVFSFCQSL